MCPCLSAPKDNSHFAMCQEVSSQARLKIKNRSVSSVESKLAAPGLDSEDAGVVCLLVECVCVCVFLGDICTHTLRGRTMPGQSGVTVTL